MAKKKKTSKASAFRKKYSKDAMVQRTKEAYDSRESSGKYEDYFDDDMPLSKWQCGKGDHVIDIIPYLAGENNPNVPSGEPTYKLDIWVHPRIGPKESMYVCPARNFDKPCPICEKVTQLRKEEDRSDDVDNEKQIKELIPKRRCAYNVVCYDSAKEEEEGIKLFEVSHFLFEQELNAVSKIKRTGGFVPFSDPDEGKTLEFTKEGEKRNTKFKGFQLTDRDEPITDETLDAAVCLEDHIKLLSYKELAKISGYAEDEEEFEEADEFDEEEEDEEDEEEVEETEEEDEEEPEEEDEDEDEDEPEEEDDIPFNEEDEPEEKPKAKRGRLKKGAASSKKSAESEKKTTKKSTKKSTKKKTDTADDEEETPKTTRRRRRK